MKKKVFPVVLYKNDDDEFTVEKVVALDLNFTMDTGLYARTFSSYRDMLDGVLEWLKNYDLYTRYTVEDTIVTYDMLLVCINEPNIPINNQPTLFQ